MSIQRGNEHDVILVGAGLGSLVAGTLLSKKKRSVLILRERGYEPTYKRDGYRFVPFSNFSERRLKPHLFQKVSEALSLPLLPNRREEGEKVEQVTFQVILPMARVDLFRQRSQLQKEWRREFPKEVTQIGQLYNELDRRGRLLKKVRTGEGSTPFFPFRPRSIIKRLISFEPSLDLSAFSREFEEFIRLQLISWGNLFLDRVPLSLAAYLLSNDESNEWTPDMDSEKLKENILDQFLRWGGTIEEIEGVEEVDAKWRKGLTISLGGDRRVLQSKCLILNSPLHHLSVLPGKVGKLLSKWAKKIEPQYVLFPLFLGVREKVIPVGMKDLLVSILNLGKPYEGGNVLFLALSRKGDETEAPERKRALTVQSLIPRGNGPKRWDQPFLVEHQEAVMKHLRQLLPFLDDHVEFIDSNWANEQASWSSYPLFLFKVSSGFHWREGVVPIRLSKNLFFAGKENFPYLGTEGEILSGWMAARQILQKHL